MSGGQKWFNDKPRPWVLVYSAGTRDWPSTSDAVDLVAAVFDRGTVAGIEWRLSEMHPSEWDALICFGGLPEGVKDGPQLFIATFGCENLPTALGPEDSGQGLGFDHRTRESLLALPDEAPPALRQLVERTLIEPLGALEVRKCLAGRKIAQTGYAAAPLPEVTPILLTKSGSVLAASYERPSGALVWALPDEAPPDQWLPYILKSWQAEAPEKFGSAESWHEQERWRSLGEREARARVRHLEDERHTVLEELDRRITEAHVAVEEASASANAAERRLLTAQGDALVHAVAEALRSLGFDVTDMDTVLPERDRREDLRVKHQREPEWEAIVEVRGYARSGAAVRDLGKLIRFKNRYERDEGREPSTCWYIVNQFIEQDPALRPPLLGSNPAEVQDFIDDDNGALIDTVQLFEIHRAVAEGTMAAEDAADSLVRLRGRLAPD